MDLIKQLTGKNPSEYEPVAKALVDNSDVKLFAKLVEQDDFLFDFIKNNVAKRIQSACNENNYLNILNFFEYYSPSYDTVFAEILYNFERENLFGKMQELFRTGSDSQKAYAVKYFSYLSKELQEEMLPELRNSAMADFEPLAINSIEVLSLLNDSASRENAVKKLESDDEFEQFNAIKFLINFQDTESLDKIIEIMKKSSLSENIACEIPYLISIPELIEKDIDKALLVLCNIINAIPEIIPINCIENYDMVSIVEHLLSLKLTSSIAVFLRLAKEKFNELAVNDEYLFDCDKNTKDDLICIQKMLSKVNNQKLDSLLYDELFDESDFVFYAIDFVEETDELRTLLDSSNQTLVLKVLTLLKEKQQLLPNDKELALKTVSNEDIRKIIEVM